MKNILLLLTGLILLTGCASFQVSTLNHDPIYVIEGSDAEITVINNEFELQRLLRTDFNFRYDFAQYAISQPRSFDWNNRVLGNRYSFYNPYYSRSQMWNDWVWGYNWNSPHNWSPFGYDRWGYNNYGWNNYGWNNWGWNNYGWNNYGWNNWGWRQQMNNYAWQHRNRPNTVRINGRRGSNNIQSRIVTNNTNRTRVVNTKPIINNSNLVIEEDGVRWYSSNKPRVIKNKPRINNNIRTINTNPTPVRIYQRPNTRSVNNSRSNSSKRGTIPNTRKRN